MATRKTTAKKTTTKKAPAKKVANTKPIVVKVVAQPEKPYRPNSARDLYWQVVQQYDGKPLSDLLAFLDDKATCPKISKTRGTPEPATGWVQFFQRQGLVQQVQA